MSALIRPTSRDPVTSYARQIARKPLKGEKGILAGRLVRLACERHLHDLERQTIDPDFPYHFDAHRAGLVGQFFVDFLTLDDGRPFELMNWSTFILGSIEGWVDAAGHQRFQTCFESTAKGTAKTPTASGYGLYCLAGKDEQSAEIYSLGVDGNQASYLYKFAQRMANRSEALKAVLDIGEHNIGWIDRACFFRPLSAEGRSLDNKRPYLAICDEVHEYPSAVIPEKMRLGFKGRNNAVLFELTNTGHDKTSVCWEHTDYSVKVLERVITGPAAERWFAYICTLDPCEKHRLEDGAMQPVDGCPDCDDWTNPICWPKVNPAIGHTITLAQMQALVDEARDRPTAQARLKRLYFCFWTQAHTIWIAQDRWEACRVPAVSERNTGQACALGFDMSEKLDLTAGVVALRVDDERGTGDTVELVEMIGDQAVKKTLNLNFCVELIPFFWLPEDTLIERVRNEHVPFDVWARAPSTLAPYLRSTPGPVIDHDLIYEQVMDEIVPAFSPQRIGYDPHNATQFAVALRDKGRQTIVEVKQGRALSESFKLFEALVRLKRIRHAGNPVLGWCVANAEPKRDRYENMWIEKPSATKRIDGLIAAVIALSQLVLLTGDVESEASRDYEQGLPGMREVDA